MQDSPITQLQIEPLSSDEFAAFGRVLSPESRDRLPINTYGDKLDLYREGFDSDQPIERRRIHHGRRKTRCARIRRHDYA
jgi:hypothetical protein